MKIMGCLPDGVKSHLDKLRMKENLFADEYRILEKIGEGTFSEVLKCVDRQSGIPVAAKILKKNLKSASHALEMPEIVALGKLTRNDHILHLIESHFEKESGQVALIFELMDMSLYDMIRTRKKPITEAKAKQILYQIVKGVNHMHLYGLFHRDLKPENILVKGDMVKIADLGSIKGIFSPLPHTEYISTRWYRSPECLLTSGYYGPKMDVWAIGCVFFELITLKPLFPGSSEVDQIAKIHHVLGTPNARILYKIQKNKARNFAANFPPKQGIGLNPLIPFISETGREVLKQVIVYDPDSRINIRRLIDHKYFADLRQSDTSLNRRASDLWNAEPRTKTSWRNPVFLSYLTNEKRRKYKLEDEKKTTNLAPVKEDSKINTKPPGDWEKPGNSLQKLKEKLSSFATNKSDRALAPAIEKIGDGKSKGSLLKRNREFSISNEILLKKSLQEVKYPTLVNLRKSHRAVAPPLGEERPKQEATGPRKLPLPVHKANHPRRFPVHQQIFGN